MKKQSEQKNGKASCDPKRKVGATLSKNCKQALCNTHNIRELTLAWEQDGQLWAKEMKIFLETLYAVLADKGGALSSNRGKRYRVQYRKLLKKGVIECMDPALLLKKEKGNRIKKSRSRKLLDRLKEHEEHIFMHI